MSAKTVTRNIRVNKDKAKAKSVAAPAKKAGMFFFQQTPGGNILRAYFMGFIAAQLGGIKANTPFRLWPAANVSGHVASKRLTKVEPNVYKLTVAGVNYLTNPEAAPDKEMVAGMVKAIKTGEKPAFYKFEMSPVES